MAPPEHSDSMTRPEHSNADEAQEIDLKKYLYKDDRGSKKGNKNSLKEIEKKQIKNGRNK